MQVDNHHKALPTEVMNQVIEAAKEVQSLGKTVEVFTNKTNDATLSLHYS
jgi:hypothetical protein